MKTVIVTGSGGLVGSEATIGFLEDGYRVIGIDNDMRARLFGSDSSTRWRSAEIEEDYLLYSHRNIDVRDAESVLELFKSCGDDIYLVVHAAAQPSHDWAIRDPNTDFTINANGTLNCLEATRQYAPQAAFAFISTNKVYGDRPNCLPFVELDTRYEISADHSNYDSGIDETMSIDQSLHSIFGASKVAADILVQEYGRYFDLNTVCFRCGCISGGSHSGAELHGFLSYLMKCVMTGTEYKIYGYQGKQVRDNIHASDLVEAIKCFARKPGTGKVYNMGGGRFSNCSLMEAIDICQNIANRRLNSVYVDRPRRGDHIWWISDISSFCAEYPHFHLKYDIETILNDICESGMRRWM